jgi:hypothetical protein
MVAATQLPWSSPFRVEDLEFLEETLTSWAAQRCQETSVML